MSKLKVKFLSRCYGLNRNILKLRDARIDKKVCGVSLCKYIPSVDRDDEKGVGSTGSESTHYRVLEKIFSHVTLSQDDTFIDVGCGSGRVLAYLKYINAPCSINGIEINEISGKIAKNWAEKYDDVNVIIGNAFDLDCDSYSVVFLGRPFLPQTFSEFIEKFESEVTHPVTFVYWVDQQSGMLLKGRSGWTMHYREEIVKVSGLRITHKPQGFSVWTYEPQK